MKQHNSLLRLWPPARVRTTLAILVGAAMPRTPAQIRQELTHALALDLIGPAPDHVHAQEALDMHPSRRYLAGFLVPYEASEDQRSDPTSQEELALGSEGGGGDDDDTPEPPSARKAHFPSSMGLSVLIPKGTGTLEVSVTWGDYAATTARDGSRGQLPAGTSIPPEAMSRPKSEYWQRTPKRAEITVQLKKNRSDVEVPGSGGLRLVVSSRKVPSERLDLVPPGTRAVSIFLVNHRVPSPDEQADQSFAFQAEITVRSEGSFIARPNLKGRESTDWDEQVGDLQYRNISEFAVGHGVATLAERGADGSCRAVRTTWMPRAEVEKVVPAAVEGVELSMEALAGATTPAELIAMLAPLASRYSVWLDEQAKAPLDHVQRREVAVELIRRAGFIRDRIHSGISLLQQDAHAFEAFRLANRAMAHQQRRRSRDFDGKGDPPSWRPFQLAFLLLNLRGIVDPLHADREVVDLLFFPTGGGKTEAYLGLAAFTLVLRRLRNPGTASAGVSVLMRYTLRLLTLDQLSRAASLICALELLRQDDVAQLGTWPFEIGLWVGQAATPNRIGRKGDNDSYSARARTIAFQNDDKKPIPIPIESCPWCLQKLTKESFRLVARGKQNNDQPTELRVQCLNRSCDFTARKDRSLPLVAVDEPIYRRLPCFLIATVDKFAGLPWIGQAGALLGKVDRADKEGFYGAADPGIGSPLDSPLLPPDLIIQDELHLISGPLGTMAGLYETAIDALSTRIIGDKKVRPKVVASTATVRRAQRQIRALFARREVDVFPPPGPDLRDSFFAQVVEASDPDAPEPGTRNARLYVGIAAQGRSLKVVLLRTYLALLAAAQKAYKAEGGKFASNPVDPYMSLLGYFSSLRELGGSRRIVEDEVRARVSGYSARTRLGEEVGLFADRRISFEVLELTSRESTSRVSEAKRRLALSFADDDRVDVALATNMISVGLDITRLGLMVVLGQPKTAAEYIQATSRVGRDDARPGLVVTLLNVHRPRDRSHYERFEAFHESFYRSVEATSVTPFAPRAVDRGLAGVSVALARHGLKELTAASHAVDAATLRPKLGFVSQLMGDRAAAHDQDRSAAVVEAQRAHIHALTDDLLDDWAKYAHSQASVGAGLQYQREEGGAPPLLHTPLDPALASLPAHARRFKANRSLRDVEPSVNLWVKTLDGFEMDPDEVEP